MDFLYAFLVLFLIVLAIYLGQLAIQFIKLERKLETVMEVLEDELVDVFGSPQPAVPVAQAETQPSLISIAAVKPPLKKDADKGKPAAPAKSAKGGAKKK